MQTVSAKKTRTHRFAFFTDSSAALYFFAAAVAIFFAAGLRTAVLAAAFAAVFAGAFFAAGFTAADDDLPPRLKTEPAKTGPAKGLVNGIDKMKPEYYKVRGWNTDGVPEKATLERLGL